MDLGLAIITGGRVPRTAVYITRTQLKFALSLDEMAVNLSSMQTGISAGFLFIFFFFYSFNGHSNEGERTRVFNAYSEGEGENVLYVQNGRQVKCQRRHVTLFVDKLVGTLVLFVPCRSVESFVSFSRCNVSDASAVALDYFYIRVANFGHILHAPSPPLAKSWRKLMMIERVSTILSHNKLLVKSPDSPKRLMCRPRISFEFSRSKVIRENAIFSKMIRIRSSFYIHFFVDKIFNFFILKTLLNKFY